MKVKVCGLTRLEDLEALKELRTAGAAYAGFIFYPQSPRFVEGKLSPLQVRSFPGSLKKTGIFVDGDPAGIRSRIRDYGLDAVQLHGKADPALCKDLRSEVMVIRALGLGPDSRPEALSEAYQDSCDLILFDKAGPGYGGHGVPFDWDLLADYRGPLPFLLSGGIGPGDAERIRSLEHPFFHGVDINSRFEIRPGEKNMEQIKSFLWALNTGGLQP